MVIDQICSTLVLQSLPAVAERLAYERKLGEKSKYAPYIAVLPTLDDDRLLALPRFWKPRRLDLVTDGGRLEARMANDERKDIGEKYRDELSRNEGMQST